MKDSLLKYIDDRISSYADDIIMRALGAYARGALYELRSLRSLLTAKIVHSEESVPDATGDSTNGICVPDRPTPIWTDNDVADYKERRKDPAFEGTDNH